MSTIARLVDASARSSLYVTKHGTLHRHYHDTNTWVTRSPHLDDHGILRVDHNQRLEAVIDRAFASSTSRSAPPPHLSRALQHVLRYEYATVDDFARGLQVAHSTAWCYAAQLVSQWPAVHAYLRRMVHPPLLEVLRRIPLEGSLRDLLARVEQEPLDVDWRCLRDRMAHLRLGRLCVEAERDV